MIEYIFLGLYCCYNITFCGNFIYVLCKENYERRQTLLRTYNINDINIDDVNIEINYSNVSSKLSTIYEV